MALFLSIPEKFLTTSIVLELLFAAITTAIAFYSYKIYNICKEREHKLFSLSFALISFASLIWIFASIFLLTKIKEGILTLELSRIIALNNMIFYFQVLFYMAGLVTLVYMTLDMKNTKLYLLLLALSIIPVIFSTTRSWLLYPISFILFIYISGIFFESYQDKRNIMTLITFSAFLLLALSRIEFLFASKDYIHFLFSDNHAMHFVVGRIIEAIAYLLLLSNLIVVMKHEQKKK